MSRFSIEADLREQAERERRRVAHYTRELENPSHGFGGQQADDADKMIQGWLRGAQSRLERIEAQLQKNRDRKKNLRSKVQHSR